MNYHEEEYNKFIKYVKGTVGSLLDTDWKEEVAIEKIGLNLHNDTLTVFIYLTEGIYYDYDFDKRELLEIEYDGKPVKTSYDLDSDLYLHMMLKANPIDDLGLGNVKLLLFDFIDGIEYDENLTKQLRHIEEEYGYDLFCMEHDL